MKDSPKFVVLTVQSDISHRTQKQKSVSPSSLSGEAAESYARLKQRRAWDLAISPAKSLPMNAFMLYMSGGGVQIFSIGILAMLLLNPIKAVSSINAGSWSLSVPL